MQIKHHTLQVLYEILKTLNYFHPIPWGKTWQTRMLINSEVTMEPLTG